MLAVFDPLRYITDANDVDSDGYQPDGPPFDPALLRRSYRDYLASEQWQTRRRRALLRAGGICRCCGVEDRRLEVHHFSYARLGCEPESDLMVLCEACHGALHTRCPRCGIRSAAGLGLGHIDGTMAKYVYCPRGSCDYWAVFPATANVADTNQPRSPT